MNSSSAADFNSNPYSNLQGVAKASQASNGLSTQESSSAFGEYLKDSRERHKVIPATHQKVLSMIQTLSSFNWSTIEPAAQGKLKSGWEYFYEELLDLVKKKPLNEQDCPKLILNLLNTFTTSTAPGDHQLYANEPRSGRFVKAVSRIKDLIMNRINSEIGRENKEKYSAAIIKRRKCIAAWKELHAADVLDRARSRVAREIIEFASAAYSSTDIAAQKEYSKMSFEVIERAEEASKNFDIATRKFRQLQREIAATHPTDCFNTTLRAIARETAFKAAASARKAALQKALKANEANAKKAAARQANSKKNANEKLMDEKIKALYKAMGIAEIDKTANGNDIKKRYTAAIAACSKWMLEGGHPDKPNKNKTDGTKFAQVYPLYKELKELGKLNKIS